MTMLENTFANVLTLGWLALCAGSVAFGWTVVRIGVSTVVSMINQSLLQKRYDELLAENPQLPEMQEAAPEQTQTGSYL